MAGYSGRQLFQKLGLKSGQRVCLIHVPKDYPDLLGPDAPRLDDVLAAPDGADLVHVFATDRATLAAQLTELVGRIARDGMIWASWPKRASKLPTDITEDTIREDALPLGLVDVKVCAVSDVWSGLKLVIRKELR